MAFLRCGQPADINEFLHEAHDHGLDYSTHVHFSIRGYGHKSPRIIIQELKQVIPNVRTDLFRWASQRLSHYSIGLSGTIGQMLTLHSLQYLVDKYNRVDPTEQPMIRKIVEGVPWTLVTHRRARRNIVNQSDNQRFFLQCLADMIELFAAVRNHDNILEQIPEREYMFYEVLEDGNDFFKPTPRVMRAVYELRVFFLIWEIQLDAKRILDTEYQIIHEDSSDDDDDNDENEIEMEAVEDSTDSSNTEDSGSESEGVDLNESGLVMEDLDYDGLAGNVPEAVQIEE